jgi:hypothetical protein
MRRNRRANVDYFDATDRLRSHDDIAREHATNGIDLDTIDLASLITAFVGIALLALVLWACGRP